MSTLKRLFAIRLEFTVRLEQSVLAERDEWGIRVHRYRSSISERRPCRQILLLLFHPVQVFLSEHMSIWLTPLSAGVDYVTFVHDIARRAGIVVSPPHRQVAQDIGEDAPDCTDGPTGYD